MKAFRVSDAVQAVGGRYFGSSDALNGAITAVSSDSRNIGEGSLFVAFKGARADGHSFMADCLKRGAVCCLSEREPLSPAETPCIVVPSTLTAMGSLAAWYRSGFEIPVVGITGSVGKTTSKEMISAVLNRKFRSHKTQKNFNNELGVPQTLLAMPEDAQAAVIEMGISNFGEMTRLATFVKPNIAVITNIGDAHLEFLHDREGVRRAKTEIFSFMDDKGLAVLNGDDDLLKDYDCPVKKVTYGCGEWNDFVAKDVVNLAGNGMRLKISHHGSSFDAVIPAFGAHMVYAALAGAATGWALGLSDAEIAAGISDYETVGNRAKLIQSEKITILSDCYNANPNSMSSAIDSLCTLAGRKVCILGDMLELGENTQKLHFQAGEKAAKAGVSLVLACGTLAKHICEGAKHAGAEALYFAKKSDLMEKMSQLLKKDDAVLVKASHSMAFEEFVEKLKKITID